MLSGRCLYLPTGAFHSLPFGLFVHPPLCPCLLSVLFVLHIHARFSSFDCVRLPHSYDPCRIDFYSIAIHVDDCAGGAVNVYDISELYYEFWQWTRGIPPLPQASYCLIVAPNLLLPPVDDEP